MRIKLLLLKCPSSFFRLPSFLSSSSVSPSLFLFLFALLGLLDRSICERVTPRLSHANSAVVLSAVKVLMKFMEMLSKDLDYYATLLKKLAPPLVTLLSAEPELQYVALRNINLIVQKRYSDDHTFAMY